MSVLFFIVGSQRSGTTLCRLALGCHREICCRDETASFQILSGTAAPAVPQRLLGLKVPQLTEQLAGPSLRDDLAIRTQGPGIAWQYSRQPIIFMLRDCRDVVASMVSLEGWLPRFGRTVLDAKINNDTVFRTTYRDAVDELRTSPFPDLAAAAFIWRYKTEAFFDYSARGYLALPIKYEALVTNPQAELRRICEFLHVEWDPRVLQHDSCEHSDLGLDGYATGGTDPGRAIDVRSTSRWRRDLSATEVDHVVRMAGPAQATLYGSDTTVPSHWPTRWFGARWKRPWRRQSG